MKRTIGESQVTPQLLQTVAPDVASPDGQKQLLEKAVGAHVAKKQLDAIMQAVAQHIGADTSSRVKQIETAAQKIGQKRLQGREYKIEDVNDMLGSRLVVKNEAGISEAKKAIEKLSQAGVFAITKQQPVKKGTYAAYHFDIALPDGTKSEIQIHTGTSEAEASINHSLRSQFGENSGNPAVEALKKKQAAITKDLSHETAQNVTQAVQSLAKSQGGQVSPIQSAQILQSAKQTR